jgi:hypothetical protein
VYLRGREIRQATDVVQVEMRDHDVPHVVSAESEALHLSCVVVAAWFRN